MFGLEDFEDYQYVPIYKKLNKDEVEKKNKKKGYKEVYPICDFFQLRFKSKFNEDKYPQNDNFDVFGITYLNEKD